jgi:16S rRNA (uracil1498-N3)-methyltransferase
MVGRDFRETSAMRRYWIPPEMIESDEVTLTGDVLHHIRDVCRMHKGSKFEVIVGGRQKALFVEITGETKHESIAKVIEEREIPAIPYPRIHLALSIPRFPVFEAVVEKAVELGVYAIHPFFSEFSFIRKQEDTWAKKVLRFEKIVMSATQQSGRGDLMPISNPVELEQILSQFNRTEGAKGLFAYEGDARLNAKEGVAKVAKEALLGELKEAWVFVGSEGGFSANEVETFKSAGLSTVTLGSQILRVETACVALISVLKYDLDLMR